MKVEMFYVTRWWSTRGIVECVTVPYFTTSGEYINVKKGDQDMFPTMCRIGNHAFRSYADAEHHVRSLAKSKVWNLRDRAGAIEKRWL